MDLFEQYGLTRVINACGKMTHLAGAIVLPEIAAAASESLDHFFLLDELQAAAGRIIAETTVTMPSPPGSLPSHAFPA